MGDLDALDPDGVPPLRPVSEWLELLDGSSLDDPRAGRWLLALLRYGRADGSPLFAPRGRSPVRLKRLRAIADRLGDPSLLGVLNLWSTSRANPSLPASPPPTASDSRADRVLCVLRPDWSPRGDLLAVDHRRTGDETLIEVASRGQTWLGPSWTSGSAGNKTGLSVPNGWTSGVFAEGVEWSYKVGRRQVTRSVVLLKGRSMAILGQQDESPEGSSEIRLDLGEGVAASLVAGSRAVLLSSGPGRPTARLIPLGLPCHDRPTDLGSIAVEGRQVVIRQVSPGRRSWLAVLLCWGKAPTAWRPLTVAFRSRTCRPEVAVAARVAWGLRDEGLVVYRSLGPPALRSFLGHQTGARFLVGAFTRTGDVRALLKMDA